MQSTDDGGLLRQYVADRSDAAFAALVTRHINLVYSVAFRQVGDPHSAEEIAQAVFILLARKAAELRHAKALSSWLFQTTRLTASNFVRSETRRHRREQEAHMQSVVNESGDDVWPQIAPLLDTAVASLSEPDRQAIMLRFYEGRNLGDVGAAMGASEDAAQKRVARAIERLREFFTKRGVTVGASGLAVVLSTHAVQAAPVGLAVTVSSGAALIGNSLVTTATQAIAMTTLQKTLTAAAISVAVLVSVMIQLRHQSDMRLVSAAEKQRADEIARFEAENEQLARSASQAKQVNQPEEFARLRREAGLLRGQTNELAGLVEERRRLKERSGPQTPLQLREETIAKIEFGKQWLVGFMNYAADNRVSFPTNFDQAAEYVPPEFAGNTNILRDQFEITYKGSLVESNSSETIVLREREAWQNTDGRWTKVYGMGDGSVLTLSIPHIVKDAAGNPVSTISTFEEFEKGRANLESGP